MECRPGPIGSRGTPHSELAPGFRHRFRQLVRTVASHIDCPQVTALRKRRYWADCIMNIAWKRRWRSGATNISGPQVVVFLDLVPEVVAFHILAANLI